MKTIGNEEEMAIRVPVGKTCDMCGSVNVKFYNKMILCDNCIKRVKDYTATKKEKSDDN